MYFRYNSFYLAMTHPHLVKTTNSNQLIALLVLELISNEARVFSTKLCRAKYIRPTF